ncbi:MAG TPA: M48 family metallopeptidase [Vicinamibacterales bacterium]|nr:M48 family metallopeptidase [Vicinamibacterales bacterium]
MNEDKSTRYHRLQRTTAWVSLAIHAFALILLVPGGAAALLRDAAMRVTAMPSHSISTVAVFTLLLLCAAEVVTFPLAFYRSFLLERRYGLSTMPLRRWLGDYGKGLAIGIVIGVLAASVVYVTLARWPRWWWMASAAAFIAAVVVLARVAPAVLLPVFYSFKPLERPSLRTRLETLSARAGLPLLGVYEWGLGEKTSRANAALVGTGRSRRILLSDTLLAHYSDDEIEVIIAHELGHHAHKDILAGLLIESLLIACSFGLAAAALHVWWRPLHLDSPADVAGLPLLLLVAGVLTLVTRPAVNALSRRNEHRADRFALTMTARPEAFVSAMRRLAQQNLAEARPSAATLWLFHTHPPFEQRIEAARAFPLPGLSQ